MELNENEINKLKEIKYNSILDKCIDKRYSDISINPTGFIRGITPELKNDMEIIKGGKYPLKPKKETLERIVYICEYSLNKANKKRNLMLANEYQNAYEWAQERLKGF